MSEDVGDQGAAAALFDELAGGFDFGPHAAGREVAGGQVAAGLGRAEGVEPALLGGCPSRGPPARLR